MAKKNSEAFCHKEEIKTVKNEVGEAFGKVSELLELISKSNYENCICGKGKPNDNESIVNENGQLKAQIEDLKYELTKRDQLKEEITRLKEELDQNSKKSEENSGENLKNLGEKIVALTDELENTKTVAEQLRNENDQLQSDQQDYVRNIDQMTDLNKTQETKIGELSKQIKDLETERDKLAKMDKKWRKQMEENDKELDKLDAEIAKLNSGLKEKDSKMVEMQKQLKENDAKIAEMQNLEKGKNQNTDKPQKSDTKDQIQEIKKLEEESLEKNKLLEKNKKQMDKLKSAFDKQNEDLDNLEKEIEAKDNEIAQLKSEIAQLSQKLHALSTDGKDSSSHKDLNKIKELEKEIENLRNELEAKHDAKKDMKEQIVNGTFTETKEIAKAENNPNGVIESSRFSVVNHDHKINHDCLTTTIRIPDNYRIVEISKVPNCQKHPQATTTLSTSPRVLNSAYLPSRHVHYCDRNFCYAKYRSDYSMPTTLLCRCPKCSKHNHEMGICRSKP
ncbi:putative leucine-rich repeat-containing protein DDB_G0290503 [Symsagittifera roscoffensis]|uniref:putative leucine-rich repeat-containing protein DDB_G0290503 n=1 Tax=Symsagittifera roscoffensis TaxID=84072 RepID=UPI00307CAE72